MKSFLLIDDHEIIRNGIKNVLIELYKPCIVVEASNEKSVIDALKEQSFDLVIMDVQMPDTDTTGLMEYIKNRCVKTKVLIFSMSDENIYAKKFLRAGAMGFISKSAGVNELKKAIDLVLNNRRYISATLAEILANEMGENTRCNPFELLSAREIDIATSIIKGVSLNEIAALLKISNSTVGTYKSRIFTKLKIKNIAELIEMGRVYNILN